MGEMKHTPGPWATEYPAADNGAEPGDRGPFDRAMGDYERAAILHGRNGDNAVAVDEAAQRVFDLFNVKHSDTPPAVDGWRVLPFSGSWKQGDERWEVYDPDGSGGAVYESNVSDPSVRGLLDALAKQAAQAGE